MKKIACVSAMTLLLLLLSFVTPRRAGADSSSGPSANGSFQLSFVEGQTKYIEFNARTHANGNTTGELIYNDPTAEPDSNVDGDPDAGGGSTGFYVRAKFDCLSVNGNKAVMSGAVTESSLLSAIGRRALLVVEDNGEGRNAPAPDRVTWGLYKPAATGWTPKDVEREDDDGASRNWIATDAEREDDAGVPSRRDETMNCRKFPLSLYTFVDLPHGAGDIQVRP